MTIALVLSVVVAGPAIAAAQDTLAEAASAFESGAFDRALELYAAAEREGGHAPERLATIHYRLGTLLAAVGEDDRARPHFDLALAIDPSLAAPPELGPSRRAPFQEVRSGRSGPARVNVRAPDDPRPEATTLEVELEAVPAGAARSVRVRVSPPGGAPWTEEQPVSGGAATVTVPPAAWRASDRVRAEVEALDAYGSVIAVGELSLVAATAPGAAVAGQSADVTAEPWFWPVVIGASVAVVVAVVVSIVVATEAEHRYVLVGF